jgi:hypothetical protein
MRTTQVTEEIEQMPVPHDAGEQAIAERASVLPLKFHAESMELKKELIKLYEREAKLIKIVNKRDEQLILASQGIPVRLPARMSKAASKAPLKEVIRLKTDLELLQKRYDALRGSKLGRLQLSYWRLRAGK